MTKLQNTLIELMKQADVFAGTGIHSRVYDLGIFTSDYLRKIKSGKQDFKDSPENRVNVQKLINAYSIELKLFNIEVK